MGDKNRDEYFACLVVDVLKLETGVRVGEYPRQDSTL